MKHKTAGQPKKYSLQKIKEGCDNYFEICELSEIHLTITGLALACGFNSRQQIYEYAEYEEYSDILKLARLRVENGYELDLRSPYVAGSKFALSNMGWSEKETVISQQSLSEEDFVDLAKEVKSLIQECGLGD